MNIRKILKTILLNQEWIMTRIYEMEETTNETKIGLLMALNNTNDIVKELEKRGEKNSEQRKNSGSGADHQSSL